MLKITDMRAGAKVTAGLTAPGDIVEFNHPSLGRKQGIVMAVEDFGGHRKMDHQPVCTLGGAVMWLMNTKEVEVLEAEVILTRCENYATD